MLQISHVKKSYQAGHPVLKDITLTVQDGDLFAFIGHNGAGKTTLIKCIAGILNFESGSITIFDQNIATQPIKAKELIAYVPDNPDVYDFMTGMQYLEFITSVYRIPTDLVKEEIHTMAKEYEIEQHLTSRIKEYSHGMKQKLVLISAFIRHPKLMILDEPFVGLDPKASKITKEYMKAFCDKGGIIFFSTHVLDVAEKICNKVAIIKQGEIILSGTMSDITSHASLEDVFLKEE